MSTYDDDYDDDYGIEDYIDDVDSNEYTIGYQDGYTAGLKMNSMRARLAGVIPYSLRRRYYALRKKLWPGDSYIPF